MPTSRPPVGHSNTDHHGLIRSSLRGGNESGLGFYCTLASVFPPDSFLFPRSSRACGSIVIGTALVTRFTTRARSLRISSSESSRVACIVVGKISRSLKMSCNMPAKQIIRIAASEFLLMLRLPFSHLLTVLALTPNAIASSFPLNRAILRRNLISCADNKLGFLIMPSTIIRWSSPMAGISGTIAPHAAQRYTMIFSRVTESSPHSVYR